MKTPPFLFFCSSSSLSIMPYYVLRKHCWVETVLKVQHCWTTLICTVACASQIIQNFHHYYWSYDRCWVMKTHFKIFRRLNQYGIQLRTHINCFVPHSDMQAEHFIFHHFSHLKRHVSATCILCVNNEGAFLALQHSNRLLSMCWPQSMITYIRKYIPYVISWISSVLSVILGWFTNLDSSSVKK